MEKNIKRFLSMALALVMAIGFLPVGHAHAGETEEVSTAKYRWEINDEGTGLVSVESGNGYLKNKLEKLNGTVDENGYWQKYQEKFAKTVELPADFAWTIEWVSTGDWGGMLLASNQTTPSANNQFFMRSATSDSVQFTYYKTSNSASLQKNWKTITFDTTVATKCRLVNELDGDTNKVMLYVGDEDTTGVEVGQTLTGQKLIFNYIGSKSTGTNQQLSNIKLDYLEITVPHTHDYTIEGETVDSTSCQESGYTVMSCECGATKNVPNGIYVEHTAEWILVSGKPVLKCTTCQSVQKTATYAWEKTKDENGAYYIKDVVTGEGVTTTDTIPETGILTSYNATFGYSVTLSPSKEWTVEWKASGTGWGMLLSKKTSHNSGNQTIYIPEGRASVNVNHYTGGNQNHYASVTLSEYTDTHTFALKNELVTVDGTTTNEIKLYIDGAHVSTMTEDKDYPNYIHTTDLVFNGIGNTSKYTLTNMNLDYILVDIPAECDHSNMGEWELTYTETDVSVLQRTCLDCGEYTEKPDYFTALYDEDDKLNVTVYETLDQALQTAGDNLIRLQTDTVYNGALELAEYQALDLNGYTLTATGAIISEYANIEDSSNGCGLLKVSSESLVITGGNNDWLPIYNGSTGYVFVQLGYQENQRMTVNSADGKTVKYYFEAKMPEYVHDYLSSADSNVTLHIEMSWTKTNEPGVAKLNCNQEMLASYYNGYDAENDKYTYAFVLTVTNADLVDADSLSFRPYFKSVCTEDLDIHFVEEE